MNNGHRSGRGEGQSKGGEWWEDRGVVEVLYGSMAAGLMAGGALVASFVAVLVGIEPVSTEILDSKAYLGLAVLCFQLLISLRLRVSYIKGWRCRFANWCKLQAMIFFVFGLDLATARPVTGFWILVGGFLCASAAGAVFLHIGSTLSKWGTDEKTL